MKNKLVIKSNRIIEARYKLTLGEQRILYLLAAAIEPKDEVFRPFKVSVKDLAELFGISYSGKLIDEVFSCLRRLRNREFTPYIEDLKASRGGKSNATIGWIEYAEYIDGDASVEIKLNDKLKPYYLNLKEKFTKIPFSAISYFKSLYSIRFYELIKLDAFKVGKNGGFEKIFNYEKLRELFEIQEEEYKYFKDFRVRVIEPAVKDISSYSDIVITSVDYKKTGRKITHIVFHCQKSKQQSFFDDENELKSNPIRLKNDLSGIAQDLFAHGIAEATALELVKKHGEERIRRNLDYFLSFRKTGATIKNPTGYLIDAIEKDYGIAQMTMQQAKEELAKKAQEKEAIAENLKATKEKTDKEQSAILWAEFLTRPEDEQDALIRSVLAGKETTLKIYDTKGKTAQVIRASVIAHLKANQ